MMLSKTGYRVVFMKLTLKEIGRKAQGLLIGREDYFFGSVPYLE